MTDNPKVADILAQYESDYWMSLVSVEEVQELLFLASVEEQRDLSHL